VTLRVQVTRGVAKDLLTESPFLLTAIRVRSKRDLEREAKPHNSQTPLLHRLRPGVNGSAGHEQHDLCSAIRCRFVADFLRHRKNELHGCALL